jgi:hypothetical protein
MLIQQSRLSRAGSLARADASCHGDRPGSWRMSLLLDGTMRTIWIVCWRGIEEECSCREDAIDRWDQLDARGIEAKVFEVFAGARRRVWLHPAS